MTRKYIYILYVSLIINYYALIFCCLISRTNFVSLGPVTILVPIFILVHA